MSWLYSQALVAEYLGENFLDGEQSAPLNGNPIQQAYCAPDKMTDFSRLSRFGMTFKPLMESRGQELLTLYLAGFHAKTLAQQEKAQELTENEAECGEKWHASFTKYDPNSSLWKTHQCSLLGDLEPFLETWPKWGLMRNGECWEQMPLAHPTKESAFGFTVPTPVASDGTTGSLIGKNDSFYETRTGMPRKVNQNGKDGSVGLGRLVQMWPTPRSCSAMAATITPESAWNQKRNPNLETIVGRVQFPTPTAHNAKECASPSEYNRNTPTLATHAGGKLNPMWVEWLMGWPLDWTDLKPLEMDKSHYVPQQLGES
jgi:hypothetical protein